MTHERDFDRLVGAWLDLMPDEVPDRTIAAVLQAVDATPQMRRPFRRLMRRFPTMNRLPVVATMAAALVLAVGGGLLLLKPGGIGNQTPTASPSIAPSPSISPRPSVSLVPDALRARWMGSERPVPPIVATSGTILTFNDDGTFFITPANLNTNHYLRSSASPTGDGQFRLESLVLGDGGCTVGDVGLYRWSVSPSGRILTVTADSDTCSTRLAAVPGVWWLEACKNTETNCLGDLDAGTYKSQYIIPRLDLTTDWVAPDFGAVTYTVPDGWANSADFPDRFTLTPSADFALEGQVGEETTQGIEVSVQPVANEQNADCKSAELKSVPRTATGLIQWIRGLPSLTSSAPTAITVDGHRGQWVDVRVNRSWKTSCGSDTVPIAAFLTMAGQPSDADVLAIVAGVRFRLVLLDLGGGDLVLINVYSPDTARFDDLVQQAMPIIQSFKFE
jgi:hypothetical protein